MFRRITLPLIILAIFGIFIARWQGAALFANLVWAEDTSLFPKTTSSLSLPISTRSTRVETETTSGQSVPDVTNTTVATPTFTIPTSTTAMRSTNSTTSTTSGQTPSSIVSPTTIPTTNTQSISSGTGTTSGQTTSNTVSPVTAPITATRATNSGAGTSYVAPVSGAVQVTTTTPNAERVEYYGQNQQGNTETYLGAAENTSSGTWSLDINAANQLPNGVYDVSARAEQRDGTVVESRPAQLYVATPENPISQEEKEVFKNSERDTDGDGISDKEEIRLGLNPKSADTDKDGFIDGDEIKNGFDPLKFSSGDKSDKIVFESPKELVTSTGGGEPIKEKESDKRFRVDMIELVEAGSDGKKATRFSGKALPNMFITLYIYSDPIIVTVKTDEDGNWTYDLDKELPDGDHEIYVAVTDNVGKISAQSEAIPFVKTAQAVAIKPAAAASAEALQNASPLERSRTEFIIIAIIIAMSFLGIALVVIGRKSSIIQ
ncbi:MAG: Ig-like domain-containing protein [Candidatus Moranbacteria bacterium]|nr:Ig-like domain-containing protein [Candidatus Moranbacteria bacterium]